MSEFTLDWFNKRHTFLFQEAFVAPQDAEEKIIKVQSKIFSNSLLPEADFVRVSFALKRAFKVRLIDDHKRLCLENEQGKIFKSVSDVSRLGITMTPSEDNDYGHYPTIVVDAAPKNYILEGNGYVSGRGALAWANVGLKNGIFRKDDLIRTMELVSGAANAAMNRMFER